jgi:N-acetylneuraminic acid mutarotase
MTGYCLRNVSLLLTVSILVLCPGVPALAATKEAPTPSLLVKVAEYRMHHARQGAAAAALGDYIYIFGGFADGALGSVERLNVNSGAIEVLTNKATARRYHAAIEYRGRFYLFGGDGQTLDRGYVTAVEIFDPKNNSFSSAPPMPAQVSGMAAVRVADRVYFMGGRAIDRSRRGWSNAMLVYDLAGEKWDRMADMPIASESKGVEVDSVALVLGGFNGRESLKSVLAFSPSENVWRELPPLPRATSAHSAAKLGDYVFLFGDYYERNEVLAYNLKTLQSGKVGIEFKGGRHTAAVEHRGRIYVLGGNQSTNSPDESDLVQVYELNPAHVGN